MKSAVWMLILCMTAFVHVNANEAHIPEAGEIEVVEMTAKKAHNLIRQQQPQLLGDGTQLVSLYYFGQNDDTSVVGLERVGDDYLPIRWLLVFKQERLLGWYYPSLEFPAKFSDGHLTFPRGSAEEDVNLFPIPPSMIVLEGKDVPFISASAVDTQNETSPPAGH